MICCVCKKEVKRTYGDPRLNGVYCKSCAEAFERVTPMDVEAYLMTNWQAILKASSQAVAGDGEEDFKYKVEMNLTPIVREPSPDLFHRLYDREVINPKDIYVPWPKTNPNLK